MTDAEEALAAFAGTRSFDAATKAADILEKFLSQCSSNGALNQAGQACLTFQPALAQMTGQFDRTNARRRRVSVTRPDRQARLRHRRRHGQRL